MENKIGVKETTDMLVALNEIALMLIKVFKNGMSISSFIELWSIYQNDDELKEKIKTAYDNYQAIPAELSDLDLIESFSLLTVEFEYIQKMISELKAKGITA